MGLPLIAENARVDAQRCVRPITTRSALRPAIDSEHPARDANCSAETLHNDLIVRHGTALLLDNLDASAPAPRAATDAALGSMMLPKIFDVEKNASASTPYERDLVSPHFCTNTLGKNYTE